MSGKKEISNEVRGEVYEKQLKRGCGLFVRCSCGTENRVPPADNQVLGSLGDAKDSIGYESSMSSWMRCEKCGNIIHLIYGDEEEIAKAEAKRSARHKEEKDAERSEHERLVLKREKEAANHYKAIKRLYGGLPRFDDDSGLPIRWSDKERSTYHLVNAYLNHEDVREEEEALSEVNK